jgi:signal peptidase I
MLSAMTDGAAFNAWAPPPGPFGVPVAGQRQVPSSRWRRIVYWVTFGPLCAAAVGLVVGVFMTIGAVRFTSATMAPTFQLGSGAVYQRDASGIVRGDVVVVQVPGYDGVLVRRIIGLPGDLVACCDSAGRVVVDGKALNEDYLPPGVVPSRTKFAVTLAPGHIWLMGDNRAIAVDSRIWGALAMSDIVGRVFQVSGSGGNTLVRTPATFTTGGLAPDDHRFPLPFLLIILALLAILAVIAQGTAGTIMWAVRRRRRQQRQQTAGVYGG